MERRRKCRICNLFPLHELTSIILIMISWHCILAGDDDMWLANLDGWNKRTLLKSINSSLSGTIKTFHVRESFLFTSTIQNGCICLPLSRTAFPARQRQKVLGHWVFLFKSCRLFMQLRRVKFLMHKWRNTTLGWHQQI